MYRIVLGVAECEHLKSVAIDKSRINEIVTHVLIQSAAADLVVSCIAQSIIFHISHSNGRVGSFSTLLTLPFQSAQISLSYYDKS